MSFRPMRNGRLCTAVGLDLSDAATPPPTPEGSVEPGVEVSFYSDIPFPFSTSSRDELLALNAKYGTPWQGDFEQMAGDCCIAVAGLAPLHTAITQNESQRVARPRPGGPPRRPPSTSPSGWPSGSARCATTRR